MTIEIDYIETAGHITHVGLVAPLDYENDDCLEIVADLAGLPVSAICDFDPTTVRFDRAYID